jgi:hypothetical protein
MFRTTKSLSRSIVAATLPVIPLLILLVCGSAKAAEYEGCNAVSLAGVCDVYDGYFRSGKCGCMKKWYSLNCPANPNVYYCNDATDLLGCMIDWTGCTL